MLPFVISADPSGVLRVYVSLCYHSFPQARKAALLLRYRENRWHRGQIEPRMHT